jgi:YhcH/YjgK/YiaL family protein
MVTDLLSNARLYNGLGERIAHALAWVNSRDIAGLAVGRYDIDGSNLYAMVSEYSTKRPEEGKWEAHRKYIDLQCVAAGEEQIGYAPLTSLSAGEYIADKEISWHTGTGSLVTMVPGRFMLLWPGDGHMPGMAIGEPKPVRKVVLKIAL